jgi:hypothetical protein
MSDVVGIHLSSQGRSCASHTACGTILQEGSLVRYRNCLIRTDLNRRKWVLGVYLVEHGRDTCLVGFLPKDLQRHSHRYRGRLARVCDMLDLSPNSYEVALSAANDGMCRVLFVTDELPYKKGSTAKATFKKRKRGMDKLLNLPFHKDHHDDDSDDIQKFLRMPGPYKHAPFMAARKSHYDKCLGYH